MTHRWARTFGRGLGLGLLLAAGLTVQSRELSFDQRVAAQRAIERTRYAHRVNAPGPFEEAFPDALLAERVRTYLRLSAALDEIWQRPVTAEMLQREYARIRARTRMPDRLREIETALGDDAFVIQECFVRAELVRRLTRSFFTADTAIHAASRARAEALREDVVSGALRVEAAHPARRVHRVVREIEDQPQALHALDPASFDFWRGKTPRERHRASPLAEGPTDYEFRVLLDDGPDHYEVAVYDTPKRSWRSFWDEHAPDLSWRDVPPVAWETPPRPRGGAFAARGAVNEWSKIVGGDVPVARSRHTAVWTGSEMIVWGGQGFFNSGGRYDPVADTWQPIDITGAPSGRVDHTAVWSGSEMIVWGGFDGGLLRTGGRYDPTTDTWTPTLADDTAPSARRVHTAVWTGTEMIVWGGEDAGGAANSGARYDPANGSWTATTTDLAPAGRLDHTAVWNGSEMLVWGGQVSLPLNSGGRYDPLNDVWRAIGTDGAPMRRYGHTAVWDDVNGEMIVWGGHDLGYVLATGGRYDPGANQGEGAWVGATPKPDAPAPREHHRAVWTGSEMLVWGGRDRNGIALDSGARYDPAGDTWAAMNPSGAPLARFDHAAVWDDVDGQLIVWGGRADHDFDSGGCYDPGTDSWVPTPLSVAPSHRQNHTAVWTGIEMLVWGGFSGGPLDSGGAYDPLMENWSPIAALDAPTARERHTAVWTGSEMIVWGGRPLTDTGGRYDPVLMQWQPMNVGDAPVGRFEHTAVWNGTEMIVWGGFATGFLNSGGRYDPATDTWVPGGTNKEGAPTRRSGHSAIWNDAPARRGMIVWGGQDGGVLRSGARYRPATDSWSPIRQLEAPEARTGHTAVWTGTEMIVWGGRDVFRLNTGARYDPAVNTRGAWTDLPTLGAPSPRTGHTAVWTGSDMIVWGGFDGQRSDSGARYDPATDAWTATESDMAPAPRIGHVAVWTPGGMIVWGGLGAALLDDGGLYGPPGPPMPAEAPRTPKRSFTRDGGLEVPRGR